MWVHAECRKPFKPVWEKYIRRCKFCLSHFFGPYEDLCKTCWKSEGYNGVYKGVKWFAASHFQVTPIEIP